MKLLRLLFLLLLLAVGAAAWLLLTPFGPSTETFVNIPTGTPTAQMAALLEQNGIIRSRFAFMAMRRVHGGTLKAGEYRFEHPAKPAEIYSRILHGDVYTVALTIPEGYNLYDIANAVQHAGLGSAQAFLTAANANTSLIQQYAPDAQSLEGYLFPDTYRFQRKATSLQMQTAMVHRFARAAQQLNFAGLPPADLSRLVTMASLIEKEVAVDSERPMVASVFENRLQLLMPLATDPTVIYAAQLDGHWTGVIHQSDLADPSLYNTYRHTGLPPGPICSPGVAALQAALHPAKTNYLYFVADAQGHSRFAATLDEHNKNVALYRSAVR